MDKQVRIQIPPERYVIPVVGVSTGLVLGILRGSRLESLRFLAENVHRAPTTVKGWYLYHKTKNYRMMFAGLKQGGKEALKLGTGGVVWVGFEEIATRGGLKKWQEICAGAGTSAVVAAICKGAFFFFPTRVSVR